MDGKILLGFVALAVLFVGRYVIYPAFFSPLWKIPNAHPLAPFTGLWMFWIRYREKVNETVSVAHQKYGPVVRLGPSELSVNCVENGIKTVYGSKEFPKHHFYDIFRNFGTTPMFATRDPALHSAKRKRVQNVYSKSYLQGSADIQAILTDTLLERFLPLFARKAESGEITDVMKPLQAVTLDLATAYSWGLQNGTRYLIDEEGRVQWYEMYLGGRPLSVFFIPVELSKMTRWLGKFGLSPLPRETFYYSDTTDAWILHLCDKAEETLASGKYDSPGHVPVVYRQLKEAIAKEGLLSAETSTSYRTIGTIFQRHERIPSDAESIITQRRSPQQIDAAAELLDDLVATNDVLGVTMTFICWELARHPDFQQRLHEELLTLSDLKYPSATGKLPTAKQLDQLPLLHAIIMETMRVHAANPGQEPRWTPPNVKTTLGPYTDIPPGVRVSASPYSMHRNVDVYPQPEEWHPERFMPTTEERGQWAGNGQAEKTFFGFSSGPRMCMGMNLSMHLLKFVMGALFSNFKLTIVDDNGMDEQTDGFMITPKADKLLLKIARWD